jgi:UDP-3-O-[3-hydroxymyristoyl] glucosamine N-acyltransferase
MARILGALFPPDRPDPGVHASAVIHPSARVADSASVGPLAVIGEEAQIGEGAVVESGCVIGRGCLIGEGCWLHARVVLYPETELGRQVTIHSGAVIGAVGFGYLPQASGHLKIPQVGQVVIEDGVEVGANTTIDRATLGRTRIGSGAIIDNLVQIGHNCDIGPMSVIVSQAGVAGSTRLGAGCILAAQSGVGDHVVLEDQVVLGGGSGIYPNTHVAAGSRLLGTPAREAQGVLRQWAMQRKLPQLLHEVKQLGVRLDELTR